MIKYKYNSLREFKKDNRTEYGYLINHKLLVKFCHDMGWETRKPNGYWTKERCMEEAKKYKTRSEWSEKSSTSYASARRNGWLKECTAHIKKNKK